MSRICCPTSTTATSSAGNNCCARSISCPSIKKINDLLEEFQTNKVHMAVVVDEYGSTLGIVSLEDILEEIVGEISDESDAVESAYTKLDDRNYLFDGKTHIGDFERILQLPEDTFCRRQGRGRDAGGADARDPARLPEEGRRRHGARPSFHGPRHRRPPHREGAR